MEFNLNYEFMTFVNKVTEKSSHTRFMILSLFVDSDDEKLKELYVDTAQKHNQKIMNDPHFYDAGFDLFLPKNYEEIWGPGTRFFSSNRDPVIFKTNKVDFKVKCSAKIYNKLNDNGCSSYFTPFYTYARSSLSKTPLRLANNQGIIDAGYRGNLIGMFDCIVNSNIPQYEESDFDWYMEEYSRLLQICAPGLIPIFVNIIDTFDELGPDTLRGDGGFGSTGK
jgi:dUTP pyrophosphatase